MGPVLRRLALVAVASIAACSNSYGGADSPAPDASAPIDASAEAASDASTAIDGDAGGDAAVPFCASHPQATLCMDFDDAPKLATLFPQEVISDARATATLAADGYSPPSSLLLAWPGGPLGGNTTTLENVHWRSAPVTFKTSLHVELRFRRTGGAPSTYTRVVNIAFPKMGPSIVLEMNVSAGAAQFGTETVPDDGGASVFDFHQLTQPLQTWSRVAIDVAGSPPLVSLTVDGQPAITPFAIDASSVAGLAPRLALTMQHYGEASPPAMELGFDDVLVDVK